MRILGYLDAFRPPVPAETLVDRMDIVDDPAFWPFFLAFVNATNSPFDAFDIDPADSSALDSVLTDESRWPVFTIPVGDGHRVRIVLNNLPDDPSVEYLLDPADGGNAVHFANLDGHFRGPGMSWAELTATSLQPDPVLSPAERMLFLLPSLGDTETPATAPRIIAAALTSVGATQSQEALAVELIEAPHFWLPVTWRTTDGVTWCSGTHALRTKDNPALRLFGAAFS
ncbi:hypothetical protein [Kibdelosporangium phytohabitans]|uniref:Uncharacterized protein n=1 Tax=Kibdelosporangium phytohabitans TaxID=860235 RepID=A0A0N9IB43_9PSEU|nr:hypothetical protein [Kibdelosporangium phytohabitans]ALG13382.1 hypothetical protein AOZ06_46815 [Kibdelosporangium phytohabitans]MBE1465177.1 hypothetical protein [Kibdelosporangium phytohabitans]